MLLFSMIVQIYVNLLFFIFPTRVEPASTRIVTSSIIVARALISGVTPVLSYE